MLFFTDATLEALVVESNTRPVFTDEIINTLMSEAVFTVRPHRKPIGELVISAWNEDGNEDRNEDDVTVGLLFDNVTFDTLVSLHFELTWDDKVSLVLSINGYEAAREQVRVTAAEVLEFKNTLADKHGVIPPV